VPVVALTGATGFVGRSLIRHMHQRAPEFRLRLLVRDRSACSTLDAHELIPGDLADRGALHELVDGVDAVVHAAAAIRGNHARSFERVNVVGTSRLVEAVAARAPSSRFIHISSLAARRPDLSWYSASKRAAEEVVQTRLQRWTVLRPPAVYGSNDPALADFWRLLARGWLIRLGPRRARFSLLHVDDLADAIRAAAVGEACRAIVTLAGPEPEGGWSWQALADAAADVRGGPVRIVPIPPTLLKAAAAGALVVGRLRRRPATLSPGKARELLHPDWVCDNLEAAHCLGVRPTTSLEQALGTLPGWKNQ
jgi:nucleoside-diphosphate-sugar epimerase